MPISPANPIRSRTLLLLLGLPLLCLGISSCGGDGGPTETSAINLSPNNVAFTTAPGGALDPKTVGITPATVDLTGLTATAAFVGTPPSPWLGTALSGTDATQANPAILTLQVTNSNLPAGTYKATVTVSSPTAANSPKVNVTLVVEAAAALAMAAQPSATVASGTALADAPVVQLQTADGDPVGQAGVEVTVALEGGGSLAGPVTSSTDAQGMATFNGLSVTALIGEHTLLFTSPSLTEVRSNPIAITVGAAASIAASSVTTQSAEAGTTVNEPPVALVTDAAGNPVEGVSVAFAPAGGGGTIVPPTATTNENGLASADTWTLGSIAGDNFVTATATGLDGSPVEFTATGTNGGVVPGPVSGTKSTVAASPATFAAGTGQTIITVTARDANNNLIGGATVTVASNGSNNTFGSTTLTTGTNGITLGKATTTYTSTKAEGKSISAQITAGAVTVSPTAAAVTVTAGAPSAAVSTVAASPGTVTGLANSSTITITVKDANSNPVSARGVTVSVGGVAGGVVLGPFSTTNSLGVTTASVSSTTGGTYPVQATITGGPTITQTASVVFLISFTNDIETGIFDRPLADRAGGMTSPCIPCHLPVGGNPPDLTFGNITGAHDAGFVVIPGDADNSLLIRALLHDPALAANELMPSSGQFLQADVIAKIRQWIVQNGTQALTQ